uniref:Magnesium transporter n=1 Tax=viral metagenome TaxID=1070528 RepID=A0A6C0ACC4_9ZZZZ
MQFITVNKDAKVSQKTYSKQYFLEIFKSLKERDINLIDRDLQFKDSDILVKEEKNIIVIKLHYIRAIISRDTVFIAKNIEKNIDASILDKLVVNIIKNQSSKNNRIESFPIIVMESIFMNIRDYFDDCVMNHTSQMLANFQKSIELDSSAYKKFFTKEFNNFYNTLSVLMSKITDIKDLFDDLDKLEDCEVEMYCLDPKEDIRNIIDIFDYYKGQFEENYNDLSRQKDSIDNMLKISQLYIGHARNKMAQFGIYLEILVLAFLIPSLVFSSLGMNVPNMWEDSKNAMTIIWILTCVIAPIIFFMGAKIFSKFTDI